MDMSPSRFGRFAPGEGMEGTRIGTNVAHWHFTLFVYLDDKSFGHVYAKRQKLGLFFRLNTAVRFEAGKQEVNTGREVGTRPATVGTAAEDKQEYEDAQKFFS
jgi:hypothetical protein